VSESLVPDGSEYRCDLCGGTFQSVPGADELANSEALALFGIKDAGSQADTLVICDDCWKKLGFNEAEI
jgi:hypothetical protein